GRRSHGKTCARMTEYLDWIDSQADAMRDQLVAWSNINSGSRNLAGLGTMLDTLATAFAPLGAESQRLSLPPLEEIDSRGNVITSPVGEALVLRKRPEAAIKVLLSIHYDTVFGASDPFQRAKAEGDVCRGPG